MCQFFPKFACRPEKQSPCIKTAFFHFGPLILSLSFCSGGGYYLLEDSINKF